MKLWTGETSVSLERMFFRLLACGLLMFSIVRLVQDNLPSATLAVGMSIMAWALSDVRRFKRLAGLSFEAEFVEIKKEADDLLDRLKDVLEVFTREVIIGRVTGSRIGGTDDSWKAHWKLYDELLEKQKELGQNIDFASIKREMDAWFIHDMIRKASRRIYESIAMGLTSARYRSNDEPSRVEFLNSPRANPPVALEIAAKQDPAEYVIVWATEWQQFLVDHYNLNVELDQGELATLRRISELYKSGPLPVTEETLRLAAG